MIRLSFDPPSDDADWKAWVAEVDAAVATMLDDQDSRPPIDEDLYKSPRLLLLAASHGKCAYCEVKVAPGQRHGDVEHYRPKGAVRDLQGKRVMIDRNGQQIKHPGYYWLAYAYSNLLPSCLACNRRAHDIASDRPTGKSDLFPTLDDKWAARPEEVETEHPALLNPWLPTDDPAEHLTFDIDSGKVIGRTERGRITVDLLGLNRNGLPEARLEACDKVVADYGDVVEDASKGRAPLARQKQALRDALTGVAEYSAFRRSAYEAARQRVLKASMELLTDEE